MTVLGKKTMGAFLLVLAIYGWSAFRWLVNQPAPMLTIPVTFSYGTVRIMANTPAAIANGSADWTTLFFMHWLPLQAMFEVVMLAVVVAIIAKVALVWLYQSCVACGVEAWLLRQLLLSRKRDA